MKFLVIIPMKFSCKIIYLINFLYHSYLLIYPQKEDPALYGKISKLICDMRSISFVLILLKILFLILKNYYSERSYFIPIFESLLRGECGLNSRKISNYIEKANSFINVLKFFCYTISALIGLYLSCFIILSYFFESMYENLCIASLDFFEIITIVNFFYNFHFFSILFFFLIFTFLKFLFSNIKIELEKGISRNIPSKIVNAHRMHLFLIIIMKKLRPLIDKSLIISYLIFWSMLIMGLILDSNLIIQKFFYYYLSPFTLIITLIIYYSSKWISQKMDDLMNSIREYYLVLLFSEDSDSVQILSILNIYINDISTNREEFQSFHFSNYVKISILTIIMYSLLMHYYIIFGDRK